MWGLYTYYGDTSIISRHLPSLSLYFDRLERLYHSSERLTRYPTGYGDWVPAGGVMGEKHLIGSFAMLHDLKMGAEFFKALPAGAERAKRCERLFRQVS